MRAPLVRLGDRSLAARAAAGDERAFEDLVRRHEPALRGYCVQLLRQVEDAEDVLQEALSAAYRALLADGAPAQPRAWLFAIVRNRCLSALRARPPEAAPLVDVATPGVAELVQSRAELRALLEDLGALPRELREALVLTRLGDLSHREVAAVLGCDAERVRSLVRQARIELAAARLARDASCEEIRVELAELRRGGFRRAHLRRHLAACEECRAFRRNLAGQDRALGAVLPLPAGVAVSALGTTGETAAGAVVAKGGLALAGSKAASSLAVGAALVTGAGVAVTVEAIDPAREPSAAAAVGGAAAAPRVKIPAGDGRRPPSARQEPARERRRSTPVAAFVRDRTRQAVATAPPAPAPSLPHRSSPAPPPPPPQSPVARKPSGPPSSPPAPDPDEGGRAPTPPPPEPEAGPAEEINPGGSTQSPGVELDSHGEVPPPTSKPETEGGTGSREQAAEG